MRHTAEVKIYYDDPGTSAGAFPWLEGRLERVVERGFLKTVMTMIQIIRSSSKEQKAQFSRELFNKSLQQFVDQFPGKLNMFNAVSEKIANCVV
jgi:hypothetical protein